MPGARSYDSQLESSKSGAAQRGSSPVWNRHGPLRATTDWPEATGTVGSLDCERSSGTAFACDVTANEEKQSSRMPRRILPTRLGLPCLDGIKIQDPIPTRWEVWRKHTLPTALRGV